MSTYTCVIYEQTEDGLLELKNRLIPLLSSFEHWRGHPTNPVQDYKPFETWIPKSELEKARQELADKEEQLRKAVTKAEHDKIRKELQLAKSRLSEMLPKSREEELRKELSAKEEEIVALRRELEKRRPKVVPAQKASVAQFRSQLVGNLSVEQVKKMLVDKDFFDSSNNKNGKGFPNNFEILQDGQVVFDQPSASAAWVVDFSLGHCYSTRVDIVASSVRAVRFGH